MLTKTLRKTTKTLKQACIEAGIEFETLDVKTLEVDTCSNCSLWWLKKEMITDRDGYLVCSFCRNACGY